jgi:predicted metal-dependent hydrolase
MSQLIAQNKLGEVLLKRYSKPHELRTDRALYQYVQDLKSEFLRNADPINKVEYDSKIHVINHALGLHTSISRVQGGKPSMRSGSPRSSRKCRWNSCA